MALPAYNAPVNTFPAAAEWRMGEKPISLNAPRIMAVVNATPDSFYAGSRFDPASNAALGEALAQLIAEGPDCLDIGGQSTRPGSPRVDSATELSRVIPAIRLARELAPELPITVDTYSAAVAREALAAGADGVNDISAGSLDPALWDVVAGAGCGYVLMHMQGTPETMQADPQYEDCVGEVHAFLESKLEELEARGIARERIAIDPGIGFGKRLEDNLALIREAGRFHDLGQPLLYGASRKSFIARLPGVDSCGAEPEGRLPATLAATWALLERGVMLHRLHDVGPARQLIALWQALRQERACTTACATI